MKNGYQPVATDDWDPENLWLVNRTDDAIDISFDGGKTRSMVLLANSTAILTPGYKYTNVAFKIADPTTFKEIH